MEKQGVIYKIENLVNGKVYIGQTVRTFKARKDQHLYELRSGIKRNIKLQSSWNKHGESSFEFSVIGNYPIHQLDEKEIYYIEKYNSFRDGYNMTTGGNQVMHNQRHTLEAKNKMSKKLKEKWSDESFIIKMQQRPIYYGSESPRSTKIICINDQKIFPSMIEAGEYYGIGLKKISSNCVGKCKYTGFEITGRKLQFAYYEEGKEYKIKELNHQNERKKVRCITTGEIFNSMTKAGEKTGAPLGSIGHVCKGRRKYAGKLPDGTKLRWEFC